MKGILVGCTPLKCTPTDMDLKSRTALLQLQFYELHFELQHNILKLSDGLPVVVNYHPKVE